jgi:hypothetical protein
MINSIITLVFGLFMLWMGNMVILNTLFYLTNQ